MFRGDAGDLDISQWKGKYVVLYFLDSTSGKESKDGHKKFRKICDSRIKSDERVKIASVRCNPSGTVETASREADDIHVPILSLNENNLLDQLKINELPTVLIIGPEWEVNFRGSSLDAAYKCILALTYAIGEG
ncbi:MAG: thioredoxin family protein [Prevotellaceae bacterium]|nr:thioredoxin family protein [Prevotellaceae bacterium]